MSDWLRDKSAFSAPMYVAPAVETTPLRGNLTPEERQQLIERRSTALRGGPNQVHVSAFVETAQLPGESKT